MVLAELACLFCFLAPDASNPALAGTKWLDGMNGLPRLSGSSRGTTRLAPPLPEPAIVADSRNWTANADVEIVDGEAVVTLTIRKVLEAGDGVRTLSPEGWRLVWKVPLPDSKRETI